MITKYAKYLDRQEKEVARMSPRRGRAGASRKTVAVDDGCKFVTLLDVGEEPMGQ